MTASAQAFLAAVTASVIATGHAVHASDALASIGWGLAAWCCISAAAGACFLRGLDA